jgi:hypothetical protein
MKNRKQHIDSQRIYFLLSDCFSDGPSKFSCPVVRIPIIASSHHTLFTPLMQGKRREESIEK